MKRVFVARLVVSIALALVGALALAPAAEAAGPPGASEWWLDRWQAPTLWADGADGRGITIAEIDSGVNAALPELSAKVLPGIDFGAAGGDGHVDREVDPFGHGTAMASIMVASAGPYGIKGLAPAAKILPVAIPLIGTEDATSNDHLADAIRWATDHGANIVNMSLGAFRSPDTDPLACPADEQAAILYALSKGTVLVAAAGNSGPGTDPIEEPGVCLGVVTVGAVDSSGTVASFSSRQPYLTVSAPGVNVPSLGRVAGQAYTGEGTSQATALTSAALALIWSKYRTLSGRQVLTRLLATLDDRRSVRSPAYGYGEINPFRAITTMVPATADNPVFDGVEPFLAALKATPPAPVPAPIAAATAPPGRFVADAAPSTITGEVRVSASVAAVGFAGLVALVVLTLRRRRRFALAGWPDPLGPGPVDGASVWHETIEPPQWTPPLHAPQWTAPPPDVSAGEPPG